MSGDEYSIISPLILVDDVSAASNEVQRQRRQAARALPKAFLFCSREAKHINGAILLHDVVKTSNPSFIEWSVARVVPLTAPAPVTKSNCIFISNVFRLRPEYEQEVRRSAATMGGSLNTHFADHMMSSWKVLRLPAADASRILQFDGTPMMLRTPLSFARSLGMQPRERTSEEHGEEMVEYGTLDVYSADVLGAERHCDAETPGDRGSTSESVHHSLLKLGKRVSGRVEVRFTPECILASLQLAFDLRPGVTLRDVLTHSAVVFFGGDCEITRGMQRGEYVLPSLRLLHDARVRLDLLAILYERELHRKYKYIRYLLLDSSPQLGYNFLCVREDRIRVPADIYSDPYKMADFDINAHFECRLCPLSTLGLGKATGIKKSVNTMNILLMESNSADDFHNIRSEYRNLTSDMGAEKALGESTVLALPMFKDSFQSSSPLAYTFPRALTLPGHLHIIFNTIQPAVEHIEIFAGFIDKLKIVQSFLCSKELRNRFRQVCIDDKAVRDKFKSYCTTHIDWRWEFLSKSLDRLLPLLGDLQRYYSEEKVLRGDAGLLTKRVIKDLTKVLEDRQFACIGECLRVTGKALEHVAHRLEGCWCHGEIWTARVGFKRKQNMLHAATGSKLCVWKGRQGPWFAAVGKSELIAAVKNNTSPAYADALGKLDESDRAAILVASQQLRLRIAEELQDKLSFWDRLPYKALGIFYGECGGSLHLSKKIAEDCMREYDDAIDRNLNHKMHRLCARLFAAGIRRRELEAFAAGGEKLYDFKHVYCELRELSLASLVERRIEEVHSRLKRLGGQMTYSTPPYLCARLRLPQHLDMIKHDVSFSEFVHKKWRMKRLPDEILQLCGHGGRLEYKSLLQRIKRVYQCDLESEFLDVSESKALEQTWLVETSNRFPLEDVALDADSDMCIKYWKGTFDVGGYYSLPLEIFNRAVAGMPVQLLPSPRVRQTLEIAGGLSPQFSATSGDVAFFEIVRLHPEKRSHVAVGYVTANKTSVNVARLSIAQLSRNTERAVVRNDASRVVQTMELRVLTMDMAQTLRSLFRWRRSGQRGMVQLIPNTLADADLPILPIEIPTAPPRASRAIVPFASTKPDITVDKQASGLVAFLHGRGAVAGSGSAGVELQDIPVDVTEAIARLKAVGMVDEIVDGRGGQTLALVPNTYAWYVAEGLQEPVAHACLGPEPDVATSKLHLMCKLTMEGWEATAQLSKEWFPDGALTCSMDARRPLSYFKALLCRDMILKKGVQSIYHQKSDAYYKCLLRLPALSLLRVLTDAEEKTDGAFVLALKSNGEDFDDENADGAVEEGAVPPPRPLPLRDAVEPALESMIDGVVADRVQETLFSRVKCDVGPGSPCYRIGFDMHTEQDRSSQRGFVECVVHGCSKRVPVGSRTKAQVCAWLYLWRCSADDHSSRVLHLSWSPSEADVAEAVKSLRMIPY